VDRKLQEVLAKILVMETAVAAASTRAALPFVSMVLGGAEAEVAYMVVPLEILLETT